MGIWYYEHLAFRDSDSAFSFAFLFLPPAPISSEKENFSAEQTSCVI
jgi:hypothetical protein